MTERTPLTSHEVLQELNTIPGLITLLEAAATTYEDSEPVFGISTTNDDFLKQAKRLHEQKHIEKDELNAMRLIYLAVLVTSFTDEQETKRRYLSVLNSLHDMLVSHRIPLSVDLEIMITMLEF